MANLIGVTGMIMAGAALPPPVGPTAPDIIASNSGQVPPNVASIQHPLPNALTAGQAVLLCAACDESITSREVGFDTLYASPDTTVRTVLQQYVATGGETEITVSSRDGTNTSGQPVSFFVLVMDREVALDVPDVYNLVGGSGSATAPLGAITSATDNTRYLGIAALDDDFDATVTTFPTGFPFTIAQNTDTTGSSGNGSAIAAISREVPSAGDTVPAVDIVFNRSDRCMTVALVLAGVGVVVPPPDPPAARTVVFSLEGQSNMQSWSGDDGGRDFPAGVLEFNQGGQLVQATHRLVHQRNNGPTASIDPAIEFCYSYLAENPDDTIILVPSANPGTGFGQGDWNPGDPSYNAAVSRLNACLALDPSYVFGGWLWAQGEQDDGDPAWAANYGNAFDTFLAARRAAVTGGAGTGVPFIVGPMVPTWVALDADRQTVQAFIEDAPNRSADLIYVGDENVTGVSGDIIHMDAPTQRLLGQRYYAAYREFYDGWVIDNTTISQSPGGVSQPVVTGTTVSAA